MAQRLEIRVSKSTGSDLNDSVLRSMRDDYLSEHGGLMATNKTLYKFDGIHTENRILVKRKKSVKNKGFVKPDVDMSRLVILGGTFEKIGGTDEAVGGGSQKVGSGNK